MRRILATAVVLVAVGAFLLCRPLSTLGLESRSAPARSYRESTARIAELRARDGAETSTECGSVFLASGRRTPRAFVLFHGLTNCPAQFDSLGRLLHATGANVLIPRLPHHGRADRMTTALAHMDARELCEFTDHVLDAAAGLGDSLTVVGLSISGTMVAWAGQVRPDVDRVVAIAPVLGLHQVPRAATTLATRLALRLPNLFFWWDSKRREQLLGPRHVYPRFSSRSISASLMMGLATFDLARHAPPAARELVMVTVGGDAAVDNHACEALVRSWRERGATVATYEFPEELHLNHDVIDPDQVGGRPEVAYPRLLELIAR